MFGAIAKRAISSMLAIKSNIDIRAAKSAWAPRDSVALGRKADRYGRVVKAWDTFQLWSLGCVSRWLRSRERCLVTSLSCRESRLTPQAFLVTPTKGPSIRRQLYDLVI